MGYMERKDVTDVLEKPEVPAELKKQLKGILEAVQQIDSKADDTKKNALEAIEKYNDLNEKYVKDLVAYKKSVEAVEKKAEAAENRVKDLEAVVALKGKAATGDERASDPLWKAFWGEGGPETKSAGFFNAGNEIEVKKLLRTDRDTEGGYLVPTMTDTMIRKKQVEVSPVRAYASSRTMTGKSMSIVVRKALAEAFYEGEAELDTEGGSTYGNENVVAWRISHTVPITRDQIIMSPFAMEQEIANDVGQSFAKKEGLMHVKGTGNKQPQGFLNHPDIERYTTASTGLLTFDDIAELTGRLKAGYNGMFYFGRKTFAKLLQIKDGQGRPLWQPVAGDRPAMIWDHPYTSTFIDMDDYVPTVSGSQPMVFGDLARAYEVFDLTGTSVIRDEVTRKKNAIIEFTFFGYNTAKVTLAEPIKVLKVK